MTTYDPTTRDSKYEGNFAQYVVDLHDAKATFNFCGGMMFQLVLSTKLRERLAASALKDKDSLVVHDAKYSKMSSTTNYSQSSAGDNKIYFHGREIRSVKNAAGGMEFVLHLSDTENDVQGWSEQERADYNGWNHDGGRPWRKIKQWQEEGVVGFADQFGSTAYGLHHRFYFHLDKNNKFWLSAEDGCEGFASGGGY